MSLSGMNLDISKPTDRIEDAHKALAQELLANDEIKAYLNEVAANMKKKIGEEEFDEAIFKALKAAADKQQAGGRPRPPPPTPPPPNEGEEVPSPSFEVFTRNIIDIIRRTRISIPEGINMILLVGLLFMMFMTQDAEGRVIRSRARTPNLDNMLNVHDPSRPGQIYSFVGAFLEFFFGIGPGAWGPDYHFMGPQRDPARGNYGYDP